MSLHQKVLNKTAQPYSWALQLRNSIGNHSVIQRKTAEFLATFNLGKIVITFSLGGEADITVM